MLKHQSVSQNLKSQTRTSKVEPKHQSTSQNVMAQAEMPWHKPKHLSNTRNSRGYIYVDDRSITHFVRIAWPPASRGPMRMGRFCPWLCALVETTKLGFGLWTGSPVLPLVRWLTATLTLPERRCSGGFRSCDLWTMR